MHGAVHLEDGDRGVASRADAVDQRVHQREGAVRVHAEQVDGGWDVGPGVAVRGDHMQNAAHVKGVDV